MNCMSMTKDGRDYRLTQYNLDFFIEDEATRKGVDSRFCVHGWSGPGSVILKQWVESLGYTVTWMKAV